MSEKTLRAMRNGGIYDHIGFGFHRYSTDSNGLSRTLRRCSMTGALLAMAYTEAYQATGKAEYSRTAREIFTYVLRDMTSKDGVFTVPRMQTAKGEEGKFYLWTEDDIRRMLLKEEAGLIISAYNMEDGGNFTEKGPGSEKKATGTSCISTSLSAGLPLTSGSLRKNSESRSRLPGASCLRPVKAHPPYKGR